MKALEFFTHCLIREPNFTYGGTKFHHFNVPFIVPSFRWTITFKKNCGIFMLVELLSSVLQIVRLGILS